jgi:hypothetical protein
MTSLAERNLNAPATATVETLTAEVRVLMVGNRQVTLSVARQLDWVTLHELKPFGRVRLNGDSDRQVIGRGHATGALVLASYEVYFGPLMILPGDVPGPLRVCATVPASDDLVRLAFDGHALRVSEECVERCTQHPRWSAEHCASWNAAPAVLDALRARIAEAESVNALHRDAARLPLIVLAGLR